MPDFIIIFLVTISIFILYYIWERQKLSDPLYEPFVSGEISELIIPTDRVYDEFYSKVYDQLVSGEQRVKGEIIFVSDWFRKYYKEPSEWSILDVGCGTGDHVAAFKKLGAGSVTGVDRSASMIRRAQNKYPADVEFVEGDVMKKDIFPADKFNIVTCFYFTIYYVPNRLEFFLNLFTWTKPGSALVIHAVNRRKFDPILDSASPFPAFSLQKYSPERVTTSRVFFDKFSYESEFKQPPNSGLAVFEEHFKFKDGSERHQKHELQMPSHEQIVEDAEKAGFIYREYYDMTTMGYEYQYLLLFTR